MDPVTFGAVLLAVVTGASEALGGRLWEGVTALVRRPARHRDGAGKEVSGQAELAALENGHTDVAKAEALARVLLERAAGDGDFDRALRQWWQEAGPVCASLGDAVNTISGGTFHGPVLQGRDFTGITFGAAPSAPPTAGPGSG